MKASGRSLIAVSFRGTLAATAAAHLASASNRELAAAEYVRKLLATRNPDLVQLMDKRCLVVGLASERGRYPPDW